MAAASYVPSLCSPTGRGAQRTSSCTYAPRRRHRHSTRPGERGKIWSGNSQQGTSSTKRHEEIHRFFFFFFLLLLRATSTQSKQYGNQFKPLQWQAMEEFGGCSFHADREALTGTGIFTQHELQDLELSAQPPWGQEPGAHLALSCWREKPRCAAPQWGGQDVKASRLVWSSDMGIATTAQLVCSFPAEESNPVSAPLT